MTGPGVYITIDVECSMGGAWGGGGRRPVTPDRAIMGRYGDRQLGVPLIIDLLSRHDLKGTFFLEPFMDEQGYPGQGEPITHAMLERDQDVQLHIHPGHKHYGLHCQGLDHPRTDQIAALEPDAQRAMLAEGAERLAGWTGQPPVAFRAGNMGASEQTLEQLAAIGITIDSSYTFPYVGGQCHFAETQRYNGSKWYGPVLEMALSAFEQPRLPLLHPAKPVDLVGISFGECRAAIRQIVGAGADCVLILHSFSLFKVRNQQYDGGKPNRVVINRLRKLCAWLGRHRDTYPVRTFAQVHEAVAAGQYQARAVPPCTLNRPIRALTRKGVQGVNRFHWV